jgi:hypothetical protein
MPSIKSVCFSFYFYTVYLILRVSGIKALLAPPCFRRSNYYKTLQDIIPGLDEYPLGSSNLKTDAFPKLKHIIMFDSVDGRAYRCVFGQQTRLTTNYSKVSKWTYLIDTLVYNPISLLHNYF